MSRCILHIFLLLGLLNFICSCNDSGYDTEYSNTTEQDDAGYKDGIWCADVEYYNPNTGTRNTYQLDVEVENNELIKIEWPNGGWLDETHFSPEDISDGECSFTSDRGYEYEITLNSEGGCGGSDAYRMQSDMEEDEKAIICPRCSGSKNEYDDLCYNCERRKKAAEEAAETCPVCYGYKMEWEKICSNCKEEREDKINLDEDN